MKDRGSLEADEEADIDHHDMEDASTLVISESALSINGEDSRDSCNQLSIDTGETDQDLVQTAAITNLVGYMEETHGSMAKQIAELKQ